MYVRAPHTTSYVHLTTSGPESYQYKINYCLQTSLLNFAILILRVTVLPATSEAIMMPWH